MKVYVVTEFTLELSTDMAEENRLVGVVRVIVTPLLIYSIRRLLKYVWMLKELVGLVELGFIMLLIVITKVDCAAAVEEMQELN